MIIYSRLDKDIPIKDIQKELINITYNWKEHFNTSHYDGSWKVLPLRTPGGADSIFPDLINAECFKDHSNLLKFPSVKKLMASMPCEIMSVRLLNLASGSVIKEHCDAELAFEKGEARLHIPIFTNPGVEFFVNNKLVTMREGECWYINANLPHRVSNNGINDRIHLVIDCKVNPWLKHLINDTETIASAPDESRSPELLKQMIISLKDQNSPVALQMAIELQQEYDNLLPNH